MNRTVKIDKTAPASGSVSYNDGYFTTTSVPVTYSVGSDSGSSLNNSSGKIQRASATLSSGSCGVFSSFSDLHTGYNDSPYSDTTVTTGNCYKYQYLIADNAGNSASYTSASVAKVDSTAPSTTDDYSAKDNQWQYSDQSITLTPTDSGGSGISWTKYCTSSAVCDPSTGTSYSSTITISTEGTSYFRYASQDSAGNTQGTVSRTVMIDKTAPGVSITSTSSNPTIVSPIPIAITFTENVTGFDVGDISVGNGNVSEFSGSGASYSANITPSVAKGTVTVNIDAGVAFDSARNGNITASQFLRSYGYSRRVVVTQ